jgi:drug/metabolite transporter (DMT)-like permease
MARFALPAVLLGAFILSSSAIFVRLSEAGPLATGAYRMLLPLPVFWQWMMLDRPGGDATPARGWPATPRDVWIIVLSGVFYAADLAAWHIAIGMTTVANATVLANTAPVFVALAAFVLFREHVTRLFLGGLVLALAGAAILMRASFAVSAETFLGDVLSVLTATFYAGYILTVARVRRRASIAAVLAIGGLTAGMILAIASWALGEQLVPVSVSGWLWLFGLAYICQVGGQSLVTGALAYLPASFGAVALLVQPIGTAILGWIVLSEAVTVDKALGIAAILAGIWLARKGTPKVP